MSVNVTPVGKLPLLFRPGVGLPVVVTVKLPEVPATKVDVFALVIAGDWLTTNVKLCVALLPTPFAAVKEIL